MNDHDAILRLHIGGQQRKNGWKILDIQPRSEVDFVGDISDLSRFADESVSEIYASHVLEHVLQAKVPETLAELCRILKPTGRLMIAVPDMDVLCAMLLDKSLRIDERFQVMRILFGGQIDPNDFHYIGLNMEFMTAYLADAGFSRLRRVDDFGLFEDTSRHKVRNTPISLNIEAWK